MGSQLNYSIEVGSREEVAVIGVLAIGVDTLNYLHLADTTLKRHCKKQKNNLITEGKQMTIATLLIGLPGSGKTTWAQEQAMRVIDLEIRALSSYALKASQPIIVDGALWLKTHLTEVLNHLVGVGYRQFQFVYWNPDVNACLHNDKVRGRNKDAAYTITNHKLVTPDLNWYSARYPSCFFAIMHKEVWQPEGGHPKAIHDAKGVFVSLTKDLDLCNLFGNTVLTSYNWRTKYETWGCETYANPYRHSDDSPVDGVSAFGDYFDKINVNLTYRLWEDLLKAEVVKQVTKVIDDYYSSGYTHHWELSVPTLYQYLTSNGLI